METCVLAAAPFKAEARFSCLLHHLSACPKVSLGWIVTADGFKTDARFKPDACGEAKEKFAIIKNWHPQVS